MKVQGKNKIKSLIYEQRRNYYTKISDIIKNTKVDLGWGKILFAQTYFDSKKLVEDLLKEKKGERNLAFYIQNPQVVLHLSQGRLFLDPSLAYRLNLITYTPPPTKKTTIQISLLTEKDIDGVNQIYSEVNALEIDIRNTLKNQYSKALTYFVAKQKEEVVGVIIGIDHKELFNSPEEGCSLWGLAVSQKYRKKGIGNLLINFIALHYQTKSRNYLDLSVLYNNQKAIRLYEKIGFKPLHRFCIKCKNEINSSLYID